MGLGQQAYAVTLVENLSQSSGGYGVMRFDQWQGSSFTTGSGSYNLNSATLRFQEIIAGANLFVRLYSDNSGQPGTVITNFTNPASISSTFADNTFTLGTPQALAANTTYWLISGVSSGSAIYYWGSTSSSNQTGLPGWTIGDGRVNSSNQSASWATSSSGPFRFSLEGTATNIPEPGSVVALLGLGGLGLASSLKKRK